MTKAHLEPKYTIPEKQLEIGQEVFIYDMSFTHKPNGKELTNEEYTRLKNTMMSGIPFIVCSEPIRKDFTGDEGRIKLSEYFIEVKVKGNEDIIMMPNRPKYCFFSNYEAMKQNVKSEQITNTKNKKNEETINSDNRFDGVIPIASARAN